MQDKMKFILIILGAVIIIMLFLLLQSGQYAGKLRTERDELKESGNVLSAKLASLNTENKHIKEDFDTAKKSLERMEAEKVEAETRFKSLVEERDRLKVGIEQLNAKLAAGQVNVNKPEEASRKEMETAPSPTADAYWAGVLKKKAELELRLENLRGDLKAAKLENEQLKREKDKLDLDIQTYETDQKDSSREFEYNKKLADNLTSDLTREKTDKFQLIETVKSLRKENKFLKSQLKTIYDRKTRLENKFTELQDKNGDLERNMVKMEAFVREKIMQVDSLKTDLGIMPPAQGQGVPPAQSLEDFSTGKKSSIELPPIVVKPGEDDSSAKPLPAKPVSIIAVDRDNNFAIVNAGSDSGIKVGDTFHIFRKGDPVGDVQVIKTRNNISACDIKNEFTPIAIGDAAK
jgi:predicted  nucleic acid-binding Zn-ribbon protein